MIKGRMKRETRQKMKILGLQNDEDEEILNKKIDEKVPETKGQNMKINGINGGIDQRKNQKKII